MYNQIEYKEPIETGYINKSIEVDSGRLSTFLNSLHLSPTIKIEVNLVDKHMINFQFTSEHINVNFTIPHMLNT